MKSQMMAAVLYGKEHLQVEPVPVPTLAEGDILVRVRVALTCGTDVKVFRRGYHARMIVPPAVFGHELAGDIVHVGENAEAGKRTPATPMSDQELQRRLQQMLPPPPEFEPSGR